jgi:hypothetical protein
MLGGYFLIAAVLSLTVDPWRINNSPLALASLENSREISNKLRLGKAALANKGDWKNIILGSSRIEIALDPTHPAFAGKRTVNLAMSSAHLYETIPVGEYVLQRNPHTETLILGIEAGDLHNDWDSRKYTSFPHSPFADNGRSIERSINAIIGGRSFADSISTIERHMAGTRSKRSPLGQWIQPNHPANLRMYAESLIGMGVENPEGPWGLDGQKMRKNKADLLSDFLRRVRDSGIAIHVVIPPVHVLKQIHPTLDEPDSMWWEHDLRALTAICAKANAIPSPGPPVRLLSFLTFNEYTTRHMPDTGAPSQRIPGWFDLGHPQSELGGKIIESVMSAQPVTDTNGSPYGIDLLANDWSRIQTDWIAAHLAYCKTHAEDVNWWRLQIAAAPRNTRIPVTPVESAE